LNRRRRVVFGTHGAIVKLPLPERIDDAKKIDVHIPASGIEGKIVEYAMELDNYEVQSAVRAQDYIRTFIRANAILNHRRSVTESDVYLYDLVHPLFLNSMGELGTENLILSVIRKNPHESDQELMKMCGVSRGTYYKYKKVFQRKSLL
jgi:hypothetical protein